MPQQHQRDAALEHLIEKRGFWNFDLMKSLVKVVVAWGFCAPLRRWEILTGQRDEIA